MQENNAQSRSVPVALLGPGPEVNGEISHWLVPLSQEKSLQRHQNISSKQTLRISSEKVWNDAQEGVHISHPAVQVAYSFALTSSVVFVYGCRLKTKKQEGQNCLQSSRILSYFSGVPTQGLEIILGCGRARAAGSRVGTSNECGRQLLQLCEKFKRAAKALATAAHLMCAASSSICVAWAHCKPILCWWWCCRILAIARKIVL